jgi:hypothetical protein
MCEGAYTVRARPARRPPGGAAGRDDLQTGDPL